MSHFTTVYLEPLYLNSDEPITHAFSHRSEAQRTKAYASPLRSLRPFEHPDMTLTSITQWDISGVLLAPTQFFRRLLEQNRHNAGCEQ